MSGKENKDTHASISVANKLCPVTRKSISSPFSGAKKKPASSGVRLPSPARRSITIPLMPSTPSKSAVTHLRSSLVNNCGILKDEQNIPKPTKCNIKPEAVVTDKLTFTKPLPKKSESVRKPCYSQPLKPQPVLMPRSNQNVISYAAALRKNENSTMASSTKLTNSSVPKSEVKNIPPSLPSSTKSTTT